MTNYFSRTWRAAVVLWVASALASCTSGSHQSQSVPTSRSSSSPTGPSSEISPTVTWSPTSGISVGGRAPGPVETTAPGIQIVPPNHIPITIGNDSYEIPASDWNTISATSTVPRDVTISFDPDFHASATTRNRFQYLADVIRKHGRDVVDMYGIASIPSGNDVITIAAFVNPRPVGLKIVRLSLTVTLGPPDVTETKGTFYASAGTNLTIGAHSIYFARLKSPLIKLSAKAKETTWNFTYDSINCKASAC